MKFSSIFSSVFSGNPLPNEILAELQNTVNISGFGKIVENNIIVEDEYDWRSRFYYENTARALLRQRSFDTIEAVAKNLRNSAARFPGGERKLYWFYRGLSLDTTASASAWESHLTLINSWLSVSPVATTAVVAAGASWAGYAWHARTAQEANAVQEEAWKLFKERLDEAAKILLNAPTSVRECPEWFLNLMVVARGQSWDISDYNNLYADGCELASDYERLHAERAVFLLPRWYGSEGDALAVIHNACQIQDEQKNSAMYSQIIRVLLRHYELSINGLSELQIDSERLLKSIQDVELLFGVNLHSLNANALFCRVVGEKQLAKNYLQQIKGDWDYQVWGAEKYFKAALKWAGI